MAWYLAPSLVNLRDEVNRKWPTRSKASDGTKGDSAHASRRSDHNPNERGSVNAIDITNAGIDVDYLIECAMRHPSTAYIISRGAIYSRRYGFAKRAYTGSNPHNTHVHISIQQTKAAEWDETRWLVKRGGFPLPPGHSFGTPKSTTVHDGTANPEDAKHVQRIQQRLRIKTTGRFGNATMVKVANWQFWRRMRPTGRVGAETWKRLGL
jgi:hypothetical protein